MLLLLNGEFRGGRNRLFRDLVVHLDRNLVYAGVELAQLQASAQGHLLTHISHLSRCFREV